MQSLPRDIVQDVTSIFRTSGYTQFLDSLTISMLTEKEERVFNILIRPYDEIPNVSKITAHSISPNLCCLQSQHVTTSQVLLIPHHSPKSPSDQQSYQPTTSHQVFDLEREDEQLETWRYDSSTQLVHRRPSQDAIKFI